MTVKSATPYLVLNGKAERAIALYEKALGARTETRQRFGDVDKSCPEAKKDLIMHAELRVGEARIMASDGDGAGQLVTGNVSVALDIDNEADGRRSFDALGATGKVNQPLIDAPWGALFGDVTDEFGVKWLFNVKKG